MKGLSLAELAISSIAKISHDSASWREPMVHRAILLSGMSLLIASIKLVNEDLECMSKDNP
tara:strand:+ start:208 stop:390 length:183 start_codon:yes stop_codon:yes gene_type:complete